jgi:hypothetical protein
MFEAVQKQAINNNNNDEDLQQVLSCIDRQIRENVGGMTVDIEWMMG